LLQLLTLRGVLLHHLVGLLLMMLLDLRLFGIVGILLG